VILSMFSADSVVSAKGHPASKIVGCWYIGGDDLTGALSIL